jgi:hypothetical protein
VSGCGTDRSVTGTRETELVALRRLAEELVTISVN